MGIAVGVHASNAVGSGTSVTTAARTSAASGSTFIIGAVCNNSEFSSVADSKSNVYTLIGAAQTFDSAGGVRLYYCQNGTGGASHTATLNVTSSAAHTVFFVEITGGLTSGILDQNNRANDTSSPFASPGITTTQADEILISILGGNSGSNPATHAESTGFTIDETVTNGTTFYTGCIASRVVSSTGTYNSSFTETGGTNTGVIIASFKAAAGGGAGLEIPRNIALIQAINRASNF